MNNNIKLYDEIINLLKEKNITQSELARKIGVTRVDISLTLKNLKAGKSITTLKLFSILDTLDKTFTINDK
ncbi:helix-turn-helix transcriptional regulator [Fusobacterium mortiferum]|uniref:helix-turn-helix domain-containing protein n=1 Tax=Fusobacterium mortiferum TaxID=850 RepID=UPI001F47E3D0|nr:helix-turn-helix transcriptional regulator [Fusobacterium mortiferum]MCF2628308.1 helix-turn-helix transcriptional regulator [Fusobacterium mortiferum]